MERVGLTPCSVPGSTFREPEDFIHAVHTNDLSVFHDALTFDGLALRTELWF